ncbi:hypothetical protein GCM10010961_40570 [Pseudodonghicola xiamenensis]|uniref:Uncharacterized protein n=1 Tax=Pseudodonghicola xiamenensis TaxID=337702 RepID=A0A8J3MF81_9RHOB|nr:hypothetical protein GCM10010961_40570 [Pseudodonghicola xiamenensis]
MINIFLYFHTFIATYHSSFPLILYPVEFPYVKSGKHHRLNQHTQMKPEAQWPPAQLRMV